MTAAPHIVSVSSGLGSAFAWKLLCDQHGPENVMGVFTDVNGEHPDNYRFLAEVQYALGSPLVKLTNDGWTIWDVMVEHRFLANSRVDICSRTLKRESFQQWLADHADPAQSTVYLGIDWTEIHRLDRARPHWEKRGWTVRAPMCEPPYPGKLTAQEWLNTAGIRRPALYDMGFGHANCGGGCVKAGIGQFRKLLFADRRWYVGWWESGEERVRGHLGKNVAILRERMGGFTRPLPLRQLRERIESCPTLFDDEPAEQGCGVCFLESPDEAA
jgi:hypothetical protein